MKATYEAHELWSAIWDWWEKVIPRAIEEFGQHGAKGAVEWRREQYDEEEVEELKQALSMKSIAPGQRSRFQRGLAGSVLEALDRFQCDLSELRVRVNLDHLYHHAHPEWIRVLMRNLPKRRVCVWVSSIEGD